MLSASAQALDARQLALIVNTRDPLSQEIGAYSSAGRHILFQNIIKVEFPPGKTTLTSAEFAIVKAAADEQTLPQIQAYALTWAAPYRVECMSITSAFAFGFDPAFCAHRCGTTRLSPYFNSRVQLPFTALRMRPAMALAATSFEQAKALRPRRGLRPFAATRHRVSAFDFGYGAQCPGAVLSAGEANPPRQNTRSRVASRCAARR